MKHNRRNVTGYQEQKAKRVGGSGLSWELISNMRRLLPLDGPCLQCNETNLESHDKGRESHAHCEGEHGIHLVEFHGFNHVPSLCIR